MEPQHPDPARESNSNLLRLSRLQMITKYYYDLCAPHASKRKMLVVHNLLKKNKKNLVFRKLFHMYIYIMLNQQSL